MNRNNSKWFETKWLWSEDFDEQISLKARKLELHRGYGCAQQLISSQRRSQQNWTDQFMDRSSKFVISRSVNLISKQWLHPYIKTNAYSPVDEIRQIALNLVRIECRWSELFQCVTVRLHFRRSASWQRRVRNGRVMEVHATQRMGTSSRTRHGVPSTTTVSIMTTSERRSSA